MVLLGSQRCGCARLTFGSDDFRAFLPFGFGCHSEFHAVWQLHTDGTPASPPMIKRLDRPGHPSYCAMDRRDD